MTDMDEAAEFVRDRQGLANFVGHLADDFIDDQESWENVTIYSFLEALSAWLRASDQLYRNLGEKLPENPSWSFFAEMLLAAKIYE